MYQLLKLHLDEKRPESWENLTRLPFETRRDWLTHHLKAIIKTLEKLKVKDENFLVPWQAIGFSCINNNLYKEAEAIYDALYKKLKDTHGNIGIPAYYRGIARFLQGRFKEAYEDFKNARLYDYQNKKPNSLAGRALLYMEETLFPTREIIRKNQEKLVKDLNLPRQIDYKIGPNVLRTIHKWNSASPLFSRGLSQGGGYFLTLRAASGAVKGIAIDPGYDFFAIMRDLGLGIADIDAIIITHDHDDHTESVEGILSMLAKYNDHNKEMKSKVIEIFGSAGVLLKFHGLLSATDPFGNKEINFHLLFPGNEIRAKEKLGFNLKITPAYHTERWTNQESSVGLVLETNLKLKSQEKLYIGITGDTRYAEGLGRNFADCQVLLLNIGSIEKEEGKFLSQHLGMLGCINLLKEARLGKPLLAILTEFGEEFSGKREIISKIIENWAQPLNGLHNQRLLKVIPADINLEIKLEELSIRESDTHVFFPYNLIDYEEAKGDLIKYKFNG